MRLILRTRLPGLFPSRLYPGENGQKWTFCPFKNFPRCDIDPEQAVQFDLQCILTYFNTPFLYSKNQSEKIEITRWVHIPLIDTYVQHSIYIYRIKQSWRYFRLFKKIKFYFQPFEDRGHPLGRPSPMMHGGPFSDGLPGMPGLLINLSKKILYIII